MSKDNPYHPFLFGIFPAVFIAAHNVDEVSFSHIFPALGIILLSIAAGYFLLSTIFRDARRAGLIVSVTAMLFFYFHSIWYAIIDVSIGTLHLGRPSFVLLGSALIVLAAAYGSGKYIKSLNAITKFLNIMGIILVAGNLGWMSVRFFGGVQASAADVVQYEKNWDRKINYDVPNKVPDIYYIILDEYGRADILKDLYGHDNGKFLQALEDRGFFVANESRSNYWATMVSLSSSLNFNVLVGKQPYAPRALGRAIRNSRARTIFHKLGYTFISFAAGYRYIEIRDADIFLSEGWSFSEYENLLYDATPLPWLTSITDRLGLTSKSGLTQHAKNILFTFETLPKIAEMKENTFTYAHIMAPHGPHHFTAEGKVRITDRISLIRDEELEPEEIRKHYIGQLIFLNRKILAVVDQILEKSTTPPIIIIQGDHGPRTYIDFKKLTDEGLREQFSILNAYYFPEGGDKLLYDGITPVNTFRILLNHYFGGKYDELPNKSFFPGPDEVIDVTDRIMPSSPAS